MKEIILLSKDARLRTLCNKAINSRVKMIDSDANAFLYINANINNIGIIIVDEKALTTDPVSYINKIDNNIPSICIYNSNIFIHKNYGKLICISKNLTNKFLTQDINNFLDDNITSNYDLIGKSKSLQKIKSLIEVLSKVDYPIHLSGETGTGKTIIAYIIHKKRHPNKEMQCLNCSELNSSLMETLLFGNKKGAYTDAKEGKAGILEKSNGSDLFLDEIGTLSLNAQERLLTVIESKEFRVVGGDTIKSEFSLITASNEDLKLLVKEKRMRLDFYYRIETFEIKIPSLRERKEDIPLLIEFYLKKIKEKRRFQSSSLEELINRKWEGNIRELNRVLQRASVLSKKEYLEII